MHLVESADVYARPAEVRTEDVVFLGAVADKCLNGVAPASGEELEACGNGGAQANARCGVRLGGCFVAEATDGARKRKEK